MADVIPFYSHSTGPYRAFSQFFPALFVIDGQTYGFAEQWMMAEKARTFPGNEDILAQIFTAKTPAAIKALGRKVRGYQESVWGSVRYGVVVKGNMAKFGQNPAIKATLLGTGEAVLVEASPDDRIWGVGLSVTDPSVKDPSKWRGQNLLGKALMEVRASLREAEAEPAAPETAEAPEPVKVLVPKKFKVSLKVPAPVPVPVPAPAPAPERPKFKATVRIPVKAKTVETPAMPGPQETRVVSVAVEQLRRAGQYNNILEWMADPNNVYIGRQSRVSVGGKDGKVHGIRRSPWANEFSVKEYGREEALRRYKVWLREELQKPDRKAEFLELKGKVLGCWCKPDPCHGDIIKEMLETLE